MEGKEITTTKNAPIDIINKAMDQNIDLDKVEKWIELQERYEANEARKAYHKAMAEFKSNPIQIDKDKKVKYLQVKYSHASLANIIEKITPGLSTVGLHLSWRTEQGDQVKVTCRIAHSLGHYEENSLCAKADSSGSKNSIQAIGSTVSYLERYTALAILGLSTKDQDDDGQSSEETEKIDENKIKIIRNLMTEVKTDEASFLKYLEVEKLEDLPKEGFLKAKVALESKKKGIK